MEKLGIDYEHVVIDNNSGDNTQKYIRDIAKTDKKFKAILNLKNWSY